MQCNKKSERKKKLLYVYVVNRNIVIYLFIFANLQLLKHTNIKIMWNQKDLELTLALACCLVFYFSVSWKTICFSLLGLKRWGEFTIFYQYIIRGLQTLFLIFFSLQSHEKCCCAHCAQPDVLGSELVGSHRDKILRNTWYRKQHWAVSRWCASMKLSKA